MKNNFFDMDMNRALTPTKHSSAKTSLNIVSDFQNTVDREIQSYFVPKINECIHYIENKDYLLLSIKWNTIETLFNIDTIKEYINEHIRNPGTRKWNMSNSVVLADSVKRSQYFELPDKISLIRNELVDNRDFVQEVIGNVDVDIESSEEEPSENDISDYENLHLDSDRKIKEDNINNNINLFDENVQDNDDYDFNQKSSQVKTPKSKNERSS